MRQMLLTEQCCAAALEALICEWHSFESSGPKHKWEDSIYQTYSYVVLALPSKFWKTCAQVATAGPGFVSALADARAPSFFVRRLIHPERRLKGWGFVLRNDRHDF